MAIATGTLSQPPDHSIKLGVEEGHLLDPTSTPAAKRSAAVPSAPTNKEDVMNQELTFALQTLRYRSLICEALLAHVKGADARAQEVINVCLGSTDVVEHIAQDLLEGHYHKAWLTQDLSSALLLLDNFSAELAGSHLQVPSREDIQALLTQIDE